MTRNTLSDARYGLSAPTLDNMHVSPCDAPVARSTRGEDSKGWVVATAFGVAKFALSLVPPTWTEALDQLMPPPTCSPMGRGSLW